MSLDSLMTCVNKESVRVFILDVVPSPACVNCVRWSNSGKYLASGGDDKLIMIWSFAKYPQGTFDPFLTKSFNLITLHVEWYTFQGIMRSSVRKVKLTSRLGDVLQHYVVIPVMCSILRGLEKIYG